MTLALKVMPRRPAQSHVLRTVRERAGLTQRVLADRIGCTPGMLQQFENGRARLSEKLAKRISFELGCDWSQLLDNMEPERPIVPSGEEFTTEFYRTYVRSGFAEQSQADGDGQAIGFMVQAILDAANQEGRYRSVTASLFSVLRDFIKELRLGQSIYELLKNYGMGVQGQNPKTDFLTRSWSAEDHVRQALETLTWIGRDPQIRANRDQVRPHLYKILEFRAATQPSAEKSTNTPSRPWESPDDDKNAETSAIRPSAPSTEPLPRRSGRKRSDKSRTSAGAHPAAT